jgi:heme oxygenase
MIMALLKESTREYHDRLEANPFSNQILKENVTTEDYLRVLERFFGFYRPLEQDLAQVLNGTYQELDFHHRRKTPLLEKDLIALGHTPGSIQLLPVCNEIPKLSSHFRLFGTLYVLEGATLGGQIISRHLFKTLALTPDNGCAFFSSYGKRVGDMWLSFKNTLDSYPLEQGQEFQVVDGAIETFTLLDCWLASAP